MKTVKRNLTFSALKKVRDLRFSGYIIASMSSRRHRVENQESAGSSSSSNRQQTNSILYDLNVCAEWSQDAEDVVRYINEAAK